MSLSRRSLLASCAASLAVPSRSFSQAPPPVTSVLFDAYNAFPHKVQLPNLPGVANCARLEIELVHYRAELANIRANKTASGRALRARFEAELDLMDQRLQDLDAAQKVADWQKAVAIAAAIGGGVLFATGILFTAPVAVGVGVGVSIISGTAFLGLQLYRVQADDTVDVVVGYSRDRAITITGVRGALVGSPAGELISNVTGVLGVVLSLCAVIDANASAASIRQQVDALKDRSIALRKVVNHLGKLDIVWGGAAERIAEAAVSGLEAFIAQYKNSGCTILSQPGPAIIPA